MKINKSNENLGADGIDLLALYRSTYFSGKGEGSCGCRSRYLTSGTVLGIYVQEDGKVK